MKKNISVGQLQRYTSHETPGYSVAKNLVDQTGFVFICGKPGTGKTHIGRHLQNDLIKKIRTIEQVSVGSVSELLQNIDMETNQFFFLDDVFGSLTPNDEVNKWCTCIDLVIQKLNEKASIDQFKSYVIITSRSSMIPRRIRQYCSIDLDDSEHQLDDTDKISILNIVHNTEIIEYEQLRNVRSNDNIGFPLCASIHAQFFEHLEITDFFVKPLKHILQLVNYLIEDRDLCKAFYIMAMNNGRICKDMFLLNVGTLSIEHEYEHYFNLVDLRCASFTRPLDNDYIEFRHVEVLEEVERNFIVNHPDEALQYVSFEAICNTVVRHGNELQDSKLYLFPTDTAVDTLLSRSFESVCNGFIFQPCQLDLWGQPTFCEKFIQILERQSIPCLEDFFSMEDRILGNRILYWTAVLHKRHLCKDLVDFLLQRNLQATNTLQLLSEALIGACSIVQLELVQYIVARGADVSYCRGCFDQSHQEEDIHYHECPIEAAYRSENEEALHYLLNQKAIIPHSIWKYWNIFHKSMEYGDGEHVLEFVCSLCQPKCERMYGTIAINEANREDIDDIFYTFVSHDLVTPGMLEAFLDLDVDMNYCGKDGSFVLLLFMKYFERNQTQVRFYYIKRCLEKGADPNRIASNDNSALLVALQMQPFSLQVLEILLRYNANPDIRGKDGSNCLHVFVCTNFEDGQMKQVLSKLVEYGANRLARTHNQLSPVQTLVLVQTNPERYIESLQYLSDNCLTEILNFRLSKKRASKTVFTLINHGCDVLRANENGETCLSLAISFYPSIVCRLLEIGADPACRDAYNRTMIERALLSDNKNMSSVVDMLLERVYNSDDCLQKFFITAFMSKHNRFNEICNLLQRYPKTAVELKDGSLQTFLHHSVSSDLTDDEVCVLVQTFNDLKGNLNSVDCQNASAIDLAAKSRKLRSKTIMFLIKLSNTNIIQNDFLLNCCTNNHITVQILEYFDSIKMLSKFVNKSRQILHKLATNKEILPHTINSIVRTLINSVVSFKLLDQCDQESNSALHVAAKCGNLSMVASLCNFAINVNLQNTLGNTALHELIAEEHVDDINARTICSEIVKVVKPKFNWSLRNCRNMTVIEILFSNFDTPFSRQKTLEYILSTCKHVNKTFNEKSILHYVLNMDKSDYYVSQLVDLILLHIPDPDVTDAFKRTALNAAAKNKQHCRLRSMLQLLTKGANSNTVDNIKQNPLMNSIKSPRGNDILTEAERLFRVVILLIFKCDKNTKSLEDETPQTLSNDYGDIKNFFLWESQKPNDALELVKLKSKTIIENMTKTTDCPSLELGLVSSSNTLNLCFQYIAEAYPYMATKSLSYDVYGVRAQVPVTNDPFYSNSQTDDFSDESDDDSESIIPEESMAIRNV